MFRNKWLERYRNRAILNPKYDGILISSPYDIFSFFISWHAHQLFSNVCAKLQNLENVPGRVELTASKYVFQLIRGSFWFFGLMSQVSYSIGSPSCHEPVSVLRF